MAAASLLAAAPRNASAIGESQATALALPRTAQPPETTTRLPIVVTSFAYGRISSHTSATSAKYSRTPA